MSALAAWPHELGIVSGDTGLTLDGFGALCPLKTSSEMTPSIL